MATGYVVALVSEARTVPDHPTVRVLTAGPGPARAERAARALLDGGATALVSWGCAGGLDPALSPGTLVLPRTVCSRDGSIFPIHRAWHEAALMALSRMLPVNVDPLVESTAPCPSSAAKRSLRVVNDAAVTDMESAGVARVAAAAGAPLLVVRAIVDPAEEGLTAATLAGIDAGGRSRTWRVARELTRNPVDLPAVVRTAWHYWRALDSLTRAARLLSDAAVRSR